MSERCKHELLPGECGDCSSPPPGIKKVVYFTSASRAFHNDPRCKALLAGQDLAVDLRNQQRRRIESHSWVEGVAVLDPCKVCCSAHQDSVGVKQVSQEAPSEEMGKTLLESWRELKQSYPEHLVFIQSGCFLEAYDEDAEKLRKARGVKVYSRGHRKIAGVPIGSKQTVINDMEAAGHLVLAYEEIAWAGDQKQRGISHETRKQVSPTSVRSSDGAPVSKASRVRAEKTKTTIEEAKKLRASTNVDVVLTEYGKMFNAFDDDAQLLSDRIGLKAFTRYGHLTVGFPLISKEVYFQKILDEGISFSTRTTKEVNGEKVRAFGSRYTPSKTHSNPSAERTTSITTTVKDANEQLPTTPLERALSFASCGFYVLPLKAGSKTPLISDWPKKATTNRLQIEAWWREHPTANVGLACEVSNLIVVDLDVSKSEKPPENWAAKGVFNGEDVLRLEAANFAEEDVFDTYSVVTPSGGKHLYFFDEGQPIKQGVEVNGLWKVDTRSRGGYIVAAGSSILASLGELREYKAIGSPTRMRPLPRWLRERLTPRQPPQATWKPSTSKVSSSMAHAILADRCRQMATTAQGRRNNELLRHASYLGRVIAKGVLNEPEVRSRLLAAAITSGLSEGEAKYTLDRGLKWGQNPT